MTILNNPLNSYQQVIYGNYKPSSYPAKLTEYLCSKFFNVPASVLLDVGCGDGTYVREFGEFVNRVQGIDNTKLYWYEIQTKSHKDTYGNHEFNINFENGKFPYLDNTFDYVFTKSVIEHVANTSHFLSEIYRVLKRDGKLVVLTPAWEYNYRDFYNDPTHVKPFHRKGLQDALKLNKFREVNAEYFYHLPFMWDRPWLSFIPRFISLFSKWKWRNKEENIHRTLIRFSQEVQLLAVAEK